MKHKPFLYLAAATACVSLTIGYVFRYATHSTTSEQGQTDPARLNLEGRSASLRKISHSAQTQQNLERTKGSEHWLHWISGIEKASLDEFARFARLAKGNDAALQIIAHRWLELDPQHFFETIQEESKLLVDEEDSVFPYQDLSSFLFREWMNTDPEAAISALSEADSLFGRDNLRRNAFSQIMNTDPLRGLALMGEWSILSYGPRTNKIEQLAQKDPRGVAQAILDNSAGYGAEHCMKAVAKVWAKNDPEAALAFATHAAGNEGAILRKTVFSQWAAGDLEAASKWLAAQDDDKVQDIYRPMVISAWAKGDPEAALTWCQDHLKGQRLTSALVQLAKGAAAKDIQSAAALVKGLSSGKQKEQAAAAVAEKWFPSRFGSGNRKVSAEAVEWLRGLGDPQVTAAVLKKIEWGWAEHDLKGFREFVSEAGSETLSARSFVAVATASAKKDPLEAMKWASDLGGDKSVSVATYVFSSWLTDQPEQASSWLRKLPADDGRRLPIMQNMVINTAYIPEAQAADRFKDFSPSDRAQMRVAIGRTALSDDRKQRLLNILNK